ISTKMNNFEDNLIFNFKRVPDIKDIRINIEEKEKNNDPVSKNEKESNEPIPEDAEESNELVLEDKNNLDNEYHENDKTNYINI
ncbi:12157_t:CDS:1, partial [Racocetra persica]